MKDMSIIEQLISELSTNEKQVLLNRLTSVRRKKESEPEIYDVEGLIQQSRFKEKVCVHCGCTHVVKFGKVGEHQRYRCKDCKTTFVSTARSTFYRCKLDIFQLRKYIQCLLYGLTIRASADACQISVKTSFLWRHRILDVLENPNKNVLLKGVVETDETFFGISFKGNTPNFIKFYGCTPDERYKYLRDNPDERPRGTKDCGCVCCGVSKNRTSLSRATNISRASSPDLFRFFRGTLDRNSLLCSDKHPAYREFADVARMNLLQFKGDKAEAKTGDFNIQRINSYHSHLKQWMLRFYGVASKYLNNYLLWYNFMFYTRNMTSVNDFLRLFADVINDKGTSSVPDRFYFPPTMQGDFPR